MLGVRTQGPYLWSRASRAGVQPPSRWPGRTEARASAAPSPKPCCGPWVPGRLLSARPSGFGPGRLHPSPPRVRAFLPRASQAGSLRRPLCRPFLRAPVRRTAAKARRAGSGVRQGAGTSARGGGGGGTRAGAQEAGRQGPRLARPDGQRGRRRRPLPERLEGGDPSAREGALSAPVCCLRSCLLRPPSR